MIQHSNRQTNSRISHHEVDPRAGAAPIVSIGMPVYNGQNYIAEALESLLSQKFDDFELIVSDNASDDATVEIVESIVAKDNRIRLHRHAENIGAAANFQYVLKAAQGRYFMWAAHDDWWAEDWLAVLIEHFDDQDVGIRGTIRLKLDGKIIAEKIPPDFSPGSYWRYFLRNENDYRSHYTYSLFDRRKLMRADISTLSLDYYPDALFVYETLKYGRLRVIRETYQEYRVHDESLGVTIAKRTRGIAKILYRVHPARYYGYYLRYTNNRLHKAMLFALIPIKHAYAQLSFWLRGARQLLTGVERV